SARGQRRKPRGPCTPSALPARKPKRPPRRHSTLSSWLARPSVAAWASRRLPINRPRPPRCRPRKIRSEESRPNYRPTPEVPMSDSPNRAVDFGAGVIVGILLAVGIGGAYMFAQVREQQMRAMMEAERAREAEMRAREEAEVAAHRAR